VRMPYRSATALVTVEREGVLSSFVTRISGKDPVVDVKLPGSYAPDVFISVMAVRGRVANWRVWMAEFAQRWKIPVLGRIANPTALVDLAKPSWRIGITKVKVGWEAHRLNVAVRPDKERYQVRDQARTAVQVLGPDGKPARSAEIAFAAVDQALLQLSPNDSWNVLDAMMGERPLSVMTSTAAMQVVGKRHYGRKALPAGGGGGGDLTDLIRTDFKPVLLWRGRVNLDANGRAQIDVPLADSLSAYKLVAIATAGGDLFGTGSATIRTVQDLTIYSGLPPLVRSGDEYGATFTLRNGTDRPLDVTRNSYYLPARYNTDLRYSRFVPIAGHYRAEVVAEFKNLFNVVQTSAVNRVVTTNADGVPAAALPATAAGFTPTGGYEQRQFQLGFKLSF